MTEPTDNVDRMRETEIRIGALEIQCAALEGICRGLSEALAEWRNIDSYAEVPTFRNGDAP